MTRALMSMSLPAMALTLLGGLTWKSPHLNLLGRIASGDLQAQAVPVTEMPAPQRREAMVPVLLHSLVLDVPRTLVPSIVCSEDNRQMRAEDDRLRCFLFAPEPHLLPDVRATAGAMQAHLPPGEVAVRAAAYRASTRELSFWMSIQEVCRLEALLECRLSIFPDTERVEVVQTDHVRGLLAFRNDGADTRILFDYFSPDERLGGMVIFSVPSGDEPAIDRVRAIAASFRITPS